MTRNITAIALLIAALPLHAAPEQDPTAKLREQLRSSLLQIRKVQTDAANAQAAQAVAEAKSKELEDKIEVLTKASAATAERNNKDKAISDQTIATLNNKLAERDKRIVQLNESLEKWMDGYRKAAAIAQTKDQERAALATEAIELKRTVADREAKNIALFNTSNEILDRYENYALGKALAAREPFVSKTRVTVENLVQGYKDKILDNRISASKPNP